MKRVTILLALLVTMTTLAFPARKPPSQGGSATVTVSCAPTCDLGEAMTIAGAGFTARKSVSISITGPSSVSMAVTADSKGRFTLYYPNGLGLVAGGYAVTAAQSGTSASTGFAIQ